MFKNLLILFVSTAFLASCASATSINLFCEEQHVEIYVDGEYVGRGLVNYVVPKGQDRIKVACRENGVEVYSRSYYIKDDKNNLIELIIPKDYRYSSGQSVIKSKVR